jgi:hypothetical protein
MIPMKCAGCGAQLEIGTDMDIFACGYCGTNQKVERKGGTVSLRLIDDAIKQVQRGTDRTASELALGRLKQELTDAELERARRLKEEELAAATALSDSVSLAHVVRMIVFFIGLFISIATVGWGALVWMLLFGWYLTVAAKRPEVERAINDSADNEVARIKQQIEAHRKILDQEISSQS